MDEKINFERIQADIFKFLEVKGFLKDVQQTCEFYQQNLEAKRQPDALSAFCFTLKLNFQEISKKKDIRIIITKETSVFLRIIEEFVKNYANHIFATSGSDIFLQSEQVHCNLRISDLPLQQNQFSLQTAHINRCLSTFHCIVFSTNPSAQYIRQSVWKCTSCFNTPLTVQRDHRDNHSVQKCFSCTSDCVEIIESRLLSDFCTAKVYEADQIKNPKKNFFVKTLDIALFDDLCQELKIGQEYIVTGIFEAHKKLYNVYNITPA